jgi:dTDP-4-amino-4,6-dideoxygalactose transaminase
MNKRINVVESFLPPKKEYDAYLDQIWSTHHLTNQGNLVTSLESKLRSYLGVDNLHFVSNGTIALQLSLKAMGVDGGEVITTPFSYVATTSSILWERCTPVFVDISPESLSIDVTKIEEKITQYTKAIMPVHVFGIVCDVDAIEKIAKKHNLAVIYDAAHAFGVKYKDKSIFNYGDISTCSFHATKLFHTIEGGAIVANSPKVSDEIELMKRFGHNGDEHHSLGINAKNSEFHAAMGHANLVHIDSIISKRKLAYDRYVSLLDDNFFIPKPLVNQNYNYAYMPVVFPSESDLMKAMKELSLNGIYARRYFYPSLNTLRYLNDTEKCPVSEDIASRICCLPLYDSLEIITVDKICKIINGT